MKPAKSAILRCVLATTIVYSAAIAGVYYYSSAMYTGPINVELTNVPEGMEILRPLLPITLLVGLKFLVFDMLTAAIRHAYVSKVPTMLFYLAYTLALFIDAYVGFTSSAPTTAADFVIFASVFHTPLILFAGLALIKSYDYIIRRKRNQDKSSSAS